MNQIDIPLKDYAIKVEETNPDTWILIFAKHNPIKIKTIDVGEGFLTEPVDLKWGGGTNQWNVGTVILLLETIIKQLKLLGK